MVFLSAASSYQLTFCYVVLSIVGFRWAGSVGIPYLPPSGVSIVFPYLRIGLLPGQIVRVVIRWRATTRISSTAGTLA